MATDIARTIYLWPDGSPNNPADPVARPRLEVYLPERPPATALGAVVVLPGGGFSRLAAHEAAPIGRWVAEQGLVGIVCTYRVAPHTFPAPMVDVGRAMRLVRAEAGALGIDPERVALMGFSAGGYLTAFTATQPEYYRDPADDLYGAHPARPQRAILCYAVTALPRDLPERVFQALFGGYPAQEVLDRLDNNAHVTPENPPAFIFHTADDPTVPVDHAFRFSQACLAQGVPVETHVYQTGRHGVGLAADNPRLRSWTGLLADWLADWRPL